MASALDKFLSTRSQLINQRGAQQQQRQSAALAPSQLQQSQQAAFAGSPQAAQQKQLQAQTQATLAHGVLAYQNAEGNPQEQQSIIDRMGTIMTDNRDFEGLEVIRQFKAAAPDVQKQMIGTAAQGFADAGLEGFQQRAQGSLTADEQLANILLDPNVPQAKKDFIRSQNPTAAERIETQRLTSEAAALGTARGKAAGDIEASTQEGTAQFQKQAEIEADRESVALAKTEAQRKEVVKNREDLNKLKVARSSAKDVLETDSSALGFEGFMTSWLPGTEGFSQRGIVDELKNKIALEAMSSLKAMSKTGSTGFGALSERELATLQESIAAIDPNANPETFRRGVTKVFDHFDRAIKYAEFGMSNPPRRESGRTYSEDELVGLSQDIHLKANLAGFSDDEIMDILVEEQVMERGGPDGWRLKL